MSILEKKSLKLMTSASTLRNQKKIWKLNPYTSKYKKGNNKDQSKVSETAEREN